MTRLRYAFDEAKVQRFIGEGRGQGLGPEYLAWLQIQDVPSTGRSHRPYGIKSRRVHHLLSDGEWMCFLTLEGNPDVEEIQEQKPMDRFETYRIAQRLGIKHPQTLDGTPYVLTLDFMLNTRIGGRLRQLPYTFKYDPEDMTPRQQALMTITREFCRLHGEELQIIDQRFFNHAFVLNYDSVRAYHDIHLLDFYDKTDVAGVAGALLNATAWGSGDTLLQTCRGLAGEFRTTPTVIHQVAMHLVSRGTLRVNLNSAVGLERLPMSAFTVGTSGASAA